MVHIYAMPMLTYRNCYTTHKVSNAIPVKKHKILSEYNWEYSTDFRADGHYMQCLTLSVWH